MLKLKGDMFSSDGTYAIMRENGDDIVYVSRIEHFAEDDECGTPNYDGWRTTNEEYKEILDRIHAAITGTVIERLRADMAYHAGEAERISRECLDCETAPEGAYSIEDDCAESYHAGRVEALDNAIHLLLGDEVVLYSETQKEDAAA